MVDDPYKLFIPEDKEAAELAARLKAAEKGPDDAPQSSPFGLGALSHLPAAAIEKFNDILSRNKAERANAQMRKWAKNDGGRPFAEGIHEFAAEKANTLANEFNGQLRPILSETANGFLADPIQYNIAQRHSAKSTEEIEVFRSKEDAAQKEFSDLTAHIIERRRELSRTNDVQLDIYKSRLQEDMQGKEAALAESMLLARSLGTHLKTSAGKAIRGKLNTEQTIEAFQGAYALTREFTDSAETLRYRTEYVLRDEENIRDAEEKISPQMVERASQLQQEIRTLGRQRSDIPLLTIGDIIPEENKQAFMEEVLIERHKNVRISTFTGYNNLGNAGITAAVTGTYTPQILIGVDDRTSTVKLKGSAQNDSIQIESNLPLHGSDLDVAATAKNASIGKQQAEFTEPTAVPHISSQPADGSAYASTVTIKAAPGATVDLTEFQSLHKNRRGNKVIIEGGARLLLLDGKEDYSNTRKTEIEIRSSGTDGSSTIISVPASTNFSEKFLGNEGTFSIPFSNPVFSPLKIASRSGPVRDNKVNIDLEIREHEHDGGHTRRIPLVREGVQQFDTPEAFIERAEKEKASLLGTPPAVGPIPPMPPRDSQAR